MTSEKVKDLLEIQVSIGQGYNRNAARLILAEEQRDLGQSAVDHLINDLNIHDIFGFNSGQEFKTP